MKKSEVQIGGHYRANVSGNPVHVKIVSVSPYGGWNAVNLSTHRKVRIRSAQRLHGNAVRADRGMGRIREVVAVVNGVTVPGIQLEVPRHADACIESAVNPNGCCRHDVVPCDDECRAGHSVDCDIRRAGGAR